MAAVPQLVMALFHRRSPGRERTRMAGIDFSSYRLNVFLFPVHPIAQEKGPIASRFKKFFQFFSEATHRRVDRLFVQAGFLGVLLPSFYPLFRAPETKANL